MKSSGAKQQTQKTKKSESVKEKNFKQSAPNVNAVVKGKGIFQMIVSDFSFKKVFGLDNPEDFLKEFLNCALKGYVGKIKSIQYLPTELGGIVEEERGVNFDIFCETDRGERILVEMQRALEKDFAERAVLNMSRAISNASRKGTKDHNITAFFSINILDFELPELKNNDKDCFHAYFFRNEKNEILTPKVGLFFINLCNFASQQLGVSDDLKHWLYMLKNMHNFTEEDYAKQEGIFRKLMDECRMNKLTDTEMEEYNKSILEYEGVKRALEYRDEIAYSRGIEDGIAKGEAKGRAEGKAEAEFNLAKKMLQESIPIDLITKCTGLTEEEIKNLEYRM